MAEFTVRAVDGAAFEDTIHGAGLPVPVEQSPLWAKYDASLAGRRHWRFLVVSRKGNPHAALSLTAFQGRFLEQLWAKQGPVWLDGAPSADDERALRSAVAAYVRRENRKAGLLRLHATYPAPDLHTPLITVFYDRTVILDLTKPLDVLQAEMTKSGRRDLRYGLRENLDVAEETTISRERFDAEIYPVFVETAERGGFHLRPSAFYYNMLTELAPACRLFTVRRDGRVLSWALVTSYDGAVDYYFAASTAAAREVFANYVQVWHVIETVHAEGAKTFDFLGTGSDRAPELATLDAFKLKFTKDGAVDVPGPWDMWLRPWAMRATNAVTWLRHTTKKALPYLGRPLRKLPAK